ncbi:DUF4060 family protein [Providencia rettgeri]|uniref:DUF4060 family protein n=1 Tax=Providencia rettgeri TaxID=587 RepID=UPI0020514DDE|nr:DUF4060 family protein [Providencia rettgeri]UPS64172.1 DUF4060 family protein [Providencia rettgeri]
MKLIIRGEVTPTERIAINAALEAHKKNHSRTGIIVNHKIKIGKNIYPVEIQNCQKSYMVTMRNERQRI